MSNKRAITMPRRRATLSKEVQAYLNVPLAANTIRGYVSDVRLFLKWGGKTSSKPEKVAEYFAYEAKDESVCDDLAKSGDDCVGASGTGLSESELFGGGEGNVAGDSTGKAVKY